MQNEKFIILSTQRSGSTLLSEYLASHTNIKLGKEIFKGNTEGRNGDLNAYKNENSIPEFLHNYYDKNKIVNGATGFKVMVDQLHRYPEVYQYIQTAKPRIIVLIRKNILKTAISRLKARATQIYHSETAIEKAPLNIDLEILDAELKKIKYANSQLRKIKDDIGDALFITYEELVSQTNETLQSVQKHLKLAPQQLTANLVKLTSDNLQDEVKNYNELYTHYKFTEYENLLVEPYIRPDNLLFIHIPKVAGTSIEKILYGTKGKVGHKKALDHVKADNKAFMDKITFTFVRNPYDRLVSSYFYLKNGGRNHYDKAWSEQHLQSFNDFEDFVINLKNPAIQEKILSWMHFIPQHKFFCDEQHNIIVDFIGRYEKINTDFKIIQNYCGCDDLPHENQSQHKEFRSYYTHELYEIVYEIYKKDFEILDYAK